MPDTLTADEITAIADQLKSASQPEATPDVFVIKSTIALAGRALRAFALAMPEGEPLTLG
jgi:hypothetical protein